MIITDNFLLYGEPFKLTQIPLTRQESSCTFPLSANNSFLSHLDRCPRLRPHHCHNYTQALCGGRMASRGCSPGSAVQHTPCNTHIRPAQCSHQQDKAEGLPGSHTLLGSELSPGGTTSSGKTHSESLSVWLMALLLLKCFLRWRTVCWHKLSGSQGDGVTASGGQCTSDVYITSQAVKTLKPNISLSGQPRVCVLAQHQSQLVPLCRNHWA